MQLRVIEDCELILAAVVLIICVLSVILMVDFDWVIGWVYSFPLKRDHSVQHWQSLSEERAWSVIQAIMNWNEYLSTFMPLQWQW